MRILSSFLIFVCLGIAAWTLVLGTFSLLGFVDGFVLCAACTVAFWPEEFPEGEEM